MINHPQLAPIVMFVYKRPLHTEKTLQFLKKNSLAKDSILYIYADGPKDNDNNETLEKIKSVRSIIRSEAWCKEVIINESDFNNGLAASIRNGVSEVIEKYGKVIVLEDDLVCSKAFLSYMNQALDYYTDKESVFSISGYNLPPERMAFPKNYPYDVYVSLRNGSWGWGTWKNRWDKIDWEVKTYPTLLQQPAMQEAFNRGGDDVFEMLKMQQEGKLNIWSIQFTLAHFVHHAVSIVPVVSYVNNIGLDGSGENCSINPIYNNQKLNNKEEIRFLDILYEDKNIINAFYSANCHKKRPLWQKGINFLFRKLGKRPPFVIKKKIYN